MTRMHTVIIDFSVFYFCFRIQGIAIYLQYLFGGYPGPGSRRLLVSRRKGIGKPIEFLGLKPSEIHYNELTHGCAAMSGREKRKIEILLKRTPAYTTNEISSEVLTIIAQFAYFVNDKISSYASCKITISKLSSKQSPSATSSI